MYYCPIIGNQRAVSTISRALSISIKMSHIPRDFSSQVSYVSGRGQLSGETYKSIHSRIGLLKVICCLMALIIVCRLLSLQIINFSTWQEWAAKQHQAKIQVASERGPILDRNGKLLAVSVPASSIFVRPREVRDAPAAAKQLAEILEISESSILEKMKKKAPFVWIKRQLPREVGEKVAAAKLPGIGEMVEARRYYPYSSAASTTIGKVGIDGQGLSGLEMVYNRLLQQSPEESSVVRDAFGNQINLPVSTEAGETFIVPKGEDLNLSLDAEIQLILDEELAHGQTEHNAAATMGVMVDAETGEILALGSTPSVNLNSETLPSKQALRNLIFETVYEPGSTMKPFVAGLAMDAGAVSAAELINCEHGSYYFGGHTVNDVHPVDTVSVRDVVVRSSNIGMTKIGVKLGKKKLYDGLVALGFGKSLNFGFPGETGGLFRKVNGWSLIDIATHSYGQGIAVTPLQMVRAMASVVNGGRLLPLRLISSEPRGEARQVFSPKTSEELREMLVAVVEDEHGTGSLAKIPGLEVGGKTGTAQKSLGGRGYSAGKYIASFLGYADAGAVGVKRKLVLLVIVDEPKGKSIYGGAVAAPVFQRVLSRSVELLALREQFKTGKNPRVEQVRWRAS